MSSIDMSNLASGLSSSGDDDGGDDSSTNNSGDSSSTEDSGITIQRLMLCDNTIGGLPALVVAVGGGMLIGIIIKYLFNYIFGTLSTTFDFIMGIVRLAGILLVAYFIQKFGHVRNMYPGMWPCGFKPSQIDPTTQAVNSVICKLGGLKAAACKLGGLDKLAQSVGGLPALIRASGGLSCIIEEYGTFDKFVCAMGGEANLHDQLPNANEFYQAMGGTGCNC